MRPSRRRGTGGEALIAEVVCRDCRNSQAKVRRKAARAGALPTAPEPGRLVKPAPPPPPLPPLENAYAEAASAREKRDLQREHGSLVEENQQLKDTIREMIAAARPPTVAVYERAAEDRADAIACALFSDWHIEEPVELDAVHGLNEFNLDIARARCQRAFQNYLRLSLGAARDRSITTLWMGWLGDFFTGWLHEENLANNLLAPGDAAQLWVEMMISGVEFLLREGPFDILVDALPGNHGRLTKRVHRGNPTGTSLETFAYHQVAGRFHGNPRVRIEVATKAMVYRNFFERFRMRLIHGYEVNFQGGVGGLTIPVRKALSQWNNPIRAQLTCMGHFHQLMSIEDFVVNGSLIGYSRFSETIKATYEDPRQAFFLVDARHGGEKSLSAPIWLD